MLRGDFILAAEEYGRHFLLSGEEYYSEMEIVYKRNALEENGIDC